MFAGKRIVVTGSASGIGAALARILASRGGDVVGLDIAAGDHVHHIIDLSDPSAIGEVEARLGGVVHGLANVAGLPGSHPAGRILAVNLLAPRALTQVLAPRLAPGSAVVNVSSVTADRCEWGPADLSVLLAKPWDEAIILAEKETPGGREAYELSKKALNQWMLCACADMSRQGVRVNCVSPGPVDTPILPDFEATIGKDRIAAAASLTGRHGRPEDIAEVLAFLLSDAARWVNGIVLKADGGLHGLRAAKLLAETL